MQGSDEIADVVLRASRALVGIAARSLAGSSSEVTLPQYRALVLLCAGGPMSMGALAGSLDCSPSTATRLCDRLVAKGLIERHEQPGNRREVQVSPTGKATRLVKAVTRRRRLELDRIVAAMPADRRQELVPALTAFSEAAGEAPDQAWAIGWDL